MRAVYARILDGERLWLAVPARPGATLTVRGLPGGEQALPTEHDAGLATARVDLAGLLAGSAEPEVVLTFALDGSPVEWSGGPLPGPTKVPPTRDGRWQLRVESADGRLRVLRAATDPVVPVTALSSDDEGALLRLSVDAGAELVSVHDERVVGSTAVGPDGLVRPDLPPGRLAVRTGGRLLPVVRRERDLKRPNFAVALPATRTGRLRWLPEGRLSIAEEER
ncbi:hypothetical protein LRP67_19605 [Nocardioides sp. cx-169]|uniref:hypothetical protein n=1 Tax=Nocardioides sp. cx-169 TaxID=2899080 RepID=UPI001E5673AB|nr:hypothetical protein [Nocardioides sp. cx-169]MCD4536304.1 hypothetical protein [Nocardioides sp. cx-169]